VWNELIALDEIPYPDDDEFNQLLHRVASEFGKVFIVFDNANSVTEAALRDLMLSLNSSASDSVFRVLFASRNACTGAFSIRPEVLEIHSRASDKDVEMYILQTLREVSGKDLSSGHEEIFHNMVKLFDGR
jgi:Ca2+-binding EF-hand superfamily protein